MFKNLHNYNDKCVPKKRLGYIQCQRPAPGMRCGLASWFEGVSS